MARYVDYQIKLLWALSFITVCRFYIQRDEHGRFVIRKSGRIRTFLYYLLWVNSVVKITYLLAIYNGWFIQVGFLDQMAMWDMFLCFSQLVQETNMWYRKYPLYEVLHANWKLQEEVFQKLGSPYGVQSRILKNDKQLVYLHTTIVLVGCGACLLQFLQTPKYSMYTYAMFPYENLLCLTIFGIHEYFYMFHIWVHQASSIVLCEVFSVTYTNIIHEMTETMKLLSVGGTLKHFRTDEEEIYETNSDQNQEGNSSSAIHTKRRKARQFLPDRVLNSKSIAFGTQYTILTLLDDYKKVMVATREFNAWVGKIMAGTNMSNYGQFISDVFMMIQLLKEPETDLMGVLFFFEDACAGMVMLFRMLILMSRLYPASEEFIQAYKTYMQHDIRIRKYLVKYNKTLRIVAAKIGGYSTNPTTVPKGVHVLFNYYICAAMWQRPVDRRT